jgi:hypothetical protein
MNKKMKNEISIFYKMKNMVYIHNGHYNDIYS